MRQPTFTRPLVLILIALGVAAAGGGCGASEDAPASTPALAASSLNRAEFAERAEAICSRGRREAIRFQPAGTDESKRDALTNDIEGTLLPSIDGAIGKLYALGAPAEEREQVEALLLAMREAVDTAEGLEPPTVEGIEDLFARSGKLARRAGLFSCAYGG